VTLETFFDGTNKFKEIGIISKHFHRSIFLTFNIRETMKEIIKNGPAESTGLIYMYNPK
jgi:hypothetical protein